jgi:Tol biopolymer transport system component
MQPLKLPRGTYRAPRVSPDGKAAAFDVEDEKDANVWVYELGGGSTPRRLTNGGHNRSPVWSPDGLWIAFQTDREGDAAIFRQRADGSGLPERLTKPDAGTSHSPQSWSPDGASLLVTVAKGNQFALWVLSVKDKRMTPFGEVKSITQIEASFSPDGRWVAYHAARRQPRVVRTRYTSNRFRAQGSNTSCRRPAALRTGCRRRTS